MPLRASHAAHSCCFEVMGGFVVRLVILCLCVGMVRGVFTRSCERGAVSLMFLNLMFMSYLSDEMYGQVNVVIITIHPYETSSLFPFDFIENDALCWPKML